MVQRWPAALVLVPLCAAGGVVGCGGAQASAVPARVATAAPGPSPAASAAIPTMPPAAETSAEALPPLPRPPDVAESAPVHAASSEPARVRVLLVDELPHRPGAHAALAPARAQAAHRRRRGHAFHGDPRVVVDVPGADHDETAAALQRDARSVGYWPFRACFEEGLRRAPDLGGAVTVRLRARARHEPYDGAEVAASTLADTVVAACVAREAGLLHLRVSAEIEDASLLTPRTLRVTLGPGDDAVLSPPAVPQAEEIRDALRAFWPAVERCYAAIFPTSPDAGGRLELRLRLGAGGRVAEIVEGETRFRPAQVTECVLAVYRGARLPGMEASRHDRAFVYPLHLEAMSEPDEVAPERGESGTSAAR